MNSMSSKYVSPTASHKGVNQMNHEQKCEIKRDAWGRVVYENGDIVGVWGSGITGWANTKFIVPTTKMFHFLLIGDYLRQEDDYVTLESVNKGVTVGRLSWYKKRNYNVFRLNDDNWKNLGYLAFNRASKFGRHRYDWFQAFRFAWAFIRHGFRPLYVDEIPYRRDNKFLCTELVFEAYRLAGVILRHPNHAPLPAEVVLAEGTGQIVKIDFHNAEYAWREKKGDIGAIFEAAGLNLGTTAPSEAEPHVYEVDKRGADVTESPVIAICGQDTQAGNVVFSPTGVALGTVVEDVKTGDQIMTREDGKWQKYSPPEAAEPVTASAPVAEAKPNPRLTPSFVGILKKGVHGTRERSHIFAQPYGLPIRVCNWERVNMEDYRALFVVTNRSAGIVNEAQEPHKSQMMNVLTCKNCQAILEAKRHSMGPIFPKTYYTAGGGGGGDVG